MSRRTEAKGGTWTEGSLLGGVTVEQVKGGVLVLSGMATLGVVWSGGFS